MDFPSADSLWERVLPRLLQWAPGRRCSQSQIIRSGTGFVSTAVSLKVRGNLQCHAAVLWFLVSGLEPFAVIVPVVTTSARRVPFQLKSPRLGGLTPLLASWRMRLLRSFQTSLLALLALCCCPGGAERAIEAHLVAGIRDPSEEPFPTYASAENREADLEKLTKRLKYHVSPTGPLQEYQTQFKKSDQEYSEAAEEMYKSLNKFQESISEFRGKIADANSRKIEETKEKMSAKLPGVHGPHPQDEYSETDEDADALPGN
ncbi:unnamed protein product [Symbiodinium sp. KB8]|nr:unnamed protein product [Symbiodinium sp. KB8]